MPQIFNNIKRELVGEGIGLLQRSIWNKTFDIPDLGDEPVGTTRVGGEVRDRLVIEATAIGLDKDLAIDAYNIDTDTTKNIVENSFIGKDGTVKEYISNGDLQASITIVLMSGEINKYPEEDFRILMDVLRYEGTIRMQSKFFDRMGVYDFAVKGYSLSAEQYEQQTITFTVSEDKSIEIEILNLNEF